MTHLAVVGSGITGALSAYLLKLRLPQINITILEKSKGTGGRMCTSRSNECQSCTADLGAQYITRTENLSQVQKNCYENLLKAGLLKPLSGHVDGMIPFKEPVEHFVCPKGSGSLAKYFLEHSGAEICFGHRVTEITESPNNKWIVKMENSGDKTFDGIIFTIPVPQVLQIHIQPANKLDENTLKKLKEVKYNSRYALACFCTRVKTPGSNSYVAKYFNNSSSIRFISFDNLKRGRDDLLPSLVVHSTKDFGCKHLEDTPEKIIPLLKEELKRLVPDLPEISEVKLLKWRYSQVEIPFSNTPGCAKLSSKPLLVCAGDGFSKSSFEGCVSSAERVVDMAASNIK